MNGQSTITLELGSANATGDVLVTVQQMQFFGLVVIKVDITKATIIVCLLVLDLSRPYQHHGQTIFVNRTDLMMPKGINTEELHAGALEADEVFGVFLDITINYINDEPGYKLVVLVVIIRIVFVVVERHGLLVDRGGRPASVFNCFLVDRMGELQYC